MSTEPFENLKVDLDDPATKAVEVTPNDSNDLDEVARFLYVGTGGNLALDLPGNSSNPVIFRNFPGGILPVRASRVRATDTTALNILACR